MHRALRPPARFVRSALRRRGYDVVPTQPFGAELVALLRRLDIDCVLDVGAFTGTYGRMLRELGYRGRIVSFEPASENFDALVREAAGDPAWETRRVGVGRAPGRLDLLLTGSAGCNSFLEPNAFAMGELPRMFGRKGVETVEVTTIDEAFDDATRGARAVFLKVDTQGYDLEVIRGAEASLPRVAALQVELALQRTYEGQPGYIEVLAELAEVGFAPAQLTPTYRDSHGRIAECDCVLVR
jgi:FkbM family methyltransferase